MKQTTIEIRIDKETKERFKQKASTEGLTMSQKILDMIHLSLANDAHDIHTITHLHSRDIQRKFNYIYNLLSDADFVQKHAVLKELGDLECLL